MKRSTKNTIIAGFFTLSATLLAGLFSVYKTNNNKEDKLTNSNNVININNINENNFSKDNENHNTFENVNDVEENYKEKNNKTESNIKEKTTNLCNIANSNSRFLDLKEGEVIEDTVGNKYTK